MNWGHCAMSPCLLVKIEQKFLYDEMCQTHLMDFVLPCKISRYATAKRMVLSLILVL